MKAVTFRNQSVSIIDLPAPEITDGEALVKISMAGICATDIEILHGYAQFHGIPGHEFVGVVESAPGRPDLNGRRVVADINIGCGHCRRCQIADARHCRDRNVIGIRGRNGAFAEYCAIPVKNLHVVPDTVETIWAVFAEPLAAALEISQQVHIRNHDRVAVIGDGKMGLLAALSMTHFSGNVQLIGRHAEKLDIAAGQGVATTQTTSATDPSELACKLGQFDLVIEATGNPRGIQDAIVLTRPEGIVVVKTTARQHSQLDLSAVTVNELTLLGSRCGDMHMALRFLNNRWVDVAPLVDTVYPFSRFSDALAHAAAKNSLKIMLAFGEDEAGTRK